MQCRQSLKPPAQYFLFAIFLLAILLIVPEVQNHNISANFFKICSIVLIPLLVDLQPCASPQPHTIISMKISQSWYPSMIPYFDAFLKQRLRYGFCNDLSYYQPYEIFRISGREVAIEVGDDNILFPRDSHPFKFGQAIIV